MNTVRAHGPALAAVVSLALCVPLAGAIAQDAIAPDADAAVQEQVADAQPPGTGDAWIDVRMDDMDQYATRYRETFIDEIARYLEAPRPVLAEALQGGMRPGDLYYACALARAAGRPCRSLITAWHANAASGWPGVAEQLELEPDGALHERIRDDIRASYRRWSRPDDHLDGPSG